HLLSHFFRGWALLHAGRFAEMLTAMAGAAAMAEKNGHDLWATLFRIELAQLRTELCDFESAAELAEQAVEHARASAEPTGQILLHGSIALAGARLGLGDLDGASAALEELVSRRSDRRRRLDRFLEPLLLELVTRLALARGELAAAERAAREIVELCGA